MAKELARTKQGVAGYHSTSLPALTAEEVRARTNLVQQVMKGVMKKDVHYGTIPGTPKPSLYKPGAEILAVTFRLAIEPTVDDLSSPDKAHYRVHTRFTSQETGAFLGEGIGECSSDEEKYRWRKAVCKEEWDDTPEDRRRQKWQKGYQNGKPTQVMQVRTNPADVANTVLKMAKKRSQVDGTLSVTGASDIFGQDLEDLPDELRTQLVEDDTAEFEEIVGSDRLADLLALAARKGKGFTPAQLLANIRRRFQFEGKLEDITVPMADAIWAGLETMPDKEGEVAKPHAPAADPQMAKLCILWNEATGDDPAKESELRAWLKATYGAESRSDLTVKERGEVIESLEGRRT